MILDNSSCNAISTMTIDKTNNKITHKLNAKISIGLIFALFRIRIKLLRIFHLTMKMSIIFKN